MLVNNLIVEIADDGNPLTFLDFKVHYIGKSFSQKVWKRLTGHTKMQKILTVEREIGSSPDARSRFEISLIILRVAGLTDVPIVGAIDENPLVGPNPIVQMIDYSDEASFDRFLHQSPVQLGDECLTREVEALLINRFRPDHNEIKYSKYPNIAGGMRSNGYSQTGLTIERLPAILYTDYQPATSLADVHPDYKFPDEPAPQIPLVQMLLGTIEE
ncbi:hypothetical protein ATM17_07870 [Sphingopyxis macrogoltabida]|uniref:Uncharacterized protein n=2 Tax=Sphingopyxis macrogoltabida TaxID=33050 RepID=A0AAC8YZ57_SPHMC|nr:curved DNA-binding protein [Sphingopyxis macrogoltabida]AMU88958.1 hypothetical protein ATM17_07870 [Sphingopyxis macrogoltabida]